MYNWFLTGGVEVDWAIGLSALAFLLAAAVLTGYMYGFDNGFERRSNMKLGEDGEDSSV